MTAAAVTLLAAGSCGNLSEKLPQHGGSDGASLSSVSLVTCVSGCIRTTKSIMAAQEESIREINIWAYTDGVLATGSFCSGENAAILLEKNKEYNIYALANTGRLNPPATEHELQSFRYHIDSYESLQEHGIPMASCEAVKVKPLSEQMSVMVTMKRLVAKYTMSAARSAADDKASFVIQSVNIRNAPSSITPFRTMSKEYERCIDGDKATSLDLKALNANGTACFYILENMQGKARGVLSPQDKCAEKIDASFIDSSKCTYVEILANVKYTDRNGNGNSYVMDKDIMYSVYLGGNNTDDLNIERNVNYIGYFRYSDFGWSFENHRCSVTETYDDTTYSIYFCSPDGTPAEELTLSSKENPAYVYFKVLPQIDENLSLRCSDDYESLHLEKYGQIEKVSEGLYRQAFINHSDQRQMNQSTVFFISDKKRGLDASVICNLESSSKGIDDWDSESDQNIYF